MKTSIFALLLALTACTPALSQTHWKAVNGSVTFTIKNAGITVSGSFGKLTSELMFSPEALATSSLKGTADVTTIKTGIAKRDKDLQGEKYFNSARYKLITVNSTKLYKKGSQYAGTFNITIKGTTKQMELPFTYSEAGGMATFHSTFTINRRDFGVGTKGGLAMAMSDDVHVTIDIKAKK